ncbi:MAG: hypothetical protein MZV63_32115 [Marinilabiliales bacterium]|nr:hypothetical protein [Marinilabiliales bacterium]
MVYKCTKNKLNERAKKIKSALISVYDKTNLEPIIEKLFKLGVKIYSTGGTKDFIEKLEYPLSGSKI